MLSTQEFADLCDTTKKTIIYYDRIDLLKPKLLKGTFRYYDVKQVLTYQKVYLLKTYGLKLQEIKNIIKNQKNLNQLFKDRYEELVEEKDILDRRITRLKEYIHNLETTNSLILPKIKQVKPYTLYTMERTGRYIDIHSFDKELGNLIGDNNLLHVYTTIFKENTYNPDKSQMIIGTIIPGKLKNFPPLKTMSIPSHKVVSYRHIGPYKYLSYVWQFLDSYILENELKRDPKNPVREFYLRGNSVEVNEENYITELQIPIL